MKSLAVHFCSEVVTLRVHLEIGEDEGLPIAYSSNSAEYFGEKITALAKAGSLGKMATSRQLM